MRTTADQQRRSIRDAQARARLTSNQLWLRYFAVGGTAGPVELDAYLHGALELSTDQADRVALAVNEILDETGGRRRATYSRPIRELGGAGTALAALTDLLHLSHMVPPEEVPGAVDTASAHLGVSSVIYLADHTDDWLVPMPGAYGQGRPDLSIDSTLAGRAFRLLEVQRSAAEDQLRLWVPIIDGAERIGVLDVMVDHAHDLHDPVLRRQCWWLTHYLGHILAATDAYGDGAELLRRRRPRSVAADLVRQLLPPLTAATDKVVVTARLEPSAEAGGDVVDYALSRTTARFALVDAAGHDLAAGLTAATALSAYRNARREQHGLFAQVQAVSTALADHLGGGAAATGVVGELDLGTGRLRYISAGHPAPLLMRHGRVVRRLEGGRRPGLGLDARDLSVGEEQLEPEDVVVLYSDGITSARDRDGRAFGVDGLVDVLERRAAEHLPLPEVVRQVCRTILTRQDGVPRDDASVLLVHWTTTGQAALEPTLMD